MSNTLSGAVAGLIVLVLTVELLRRRALREKYAVLWLGVSVAALLFGFFPTALDGLARALGFQVPANLLFAVAALVLLAVSMQLSLEVSRLENRSQRLAEEVALLRSDLEKLAPVDPDAAGPSADGLPGDER